MIEKMLISAVASCVLALGANAQDFKGFSHPESVYGMGGDIFVSNVGEKLEPLSKDKDGFISKLDTNGEIKIKKFISNLNAPKGMNSIGNTLYVVDIDVLNGFDKTSGKEVFSLDIKGAVFLNAIEVLDDNTLLVSDTGTGIIHKVDLKNKKHETLVQLDSKLGGPNGLLLDKEKKNLIAVGYDPNGKDKGSIVLINLESKKVQNLSEPLGALDGIVYAKNGDLLVSDWGENTRGVIYRVNKNKISTLKMQSIGGPADMYSDGESLWIPAMMENKILKIELP
ncbi:ATP-binding protein [Helicobacter burdigaliensis]|uniref:ATP-binding protein n=1 Tax=Helicobacter burdigaliensis TaxID=2315334 RepID=UPI000EF73482|nr:ATP-binding protein [Helicobacter burdigaliensis]